MTPRPDRPSEWGTIGEHEQRIRVLEANPSGGSGGTVFCTGCYEVDPEFAGCVNLAAGDVMEVPSQSIPASNPSVFEVPNTEWEIGPYLCNYNAGFRIQGRYVGAVAGNSLQWKIWLGIGHEGATPSTWTDMGFVADGTAKNIDTGWITATDIPAVGANADAWQLWMGANNTSVLFDGTLGLGLWFYRYVGVDALSNYTPQPQIEGQILVAVPDTGGTFKWATLDPGTVGQVLTISAGGVPEWA